MTPNVTPEQIQSLVLAAVCWGWFFLLGPMRAFRVGVATEQIPISLKMSGFKLLRILALVAMAALAVLIPIQEPSIEDRLLYALFPTTGAMAATPTAVLGSAALLLLLPALVANSRRRAGRPVDGWQTPALTLWGWTWTGVAFLLAMGVPQYFIPPLDLVFGEALTIETAIGVIAIGVLFYVAWWGLPGVAVGAQARKGDPRSIGALARVRWVGLPAFLMHLVRAPKKGRASSTAVDRRYCPSCMRPIDVIADYATLDFDHCPQCHEVIPAVFTLEDFINHIATQALDLHADDTRSRRRNKLEKQQEDNVQQMLRGLLTMGLRNRATDIHVVNDNGMLQVRFRIDGVLQTLFSFPMALSRMLISVIKVQARLDISEQRKPQDGSFKTTVDGTKLDVRVNTSPTSEGETASLRLIYRTRCLGRIEDLGMGGRVRAMIEQTIQHPHGLVLVTGPTGSGKSTTLYNSLATIADGRRNIITLEDPIEFRIEGLTQMQIEPRKGFDFATGLRSILRQDPDVIMVGEVRDAETAKMAVDASMTGHLVFTTLHTIDSSTAIGRLNDLGVDPHQHAEALLLIIAQRLVRLICRDCAEDLTVTREELEAMGLPGGPPRLQVRRGRGCPTCFETGYYEREGIYEMLPGSKRIKQMISERATPTMIREAARNEGMRTLLEEGLVKVVLGRTSIEEVLRVTS